MLTKNAGLQSSSKQYIKKATYQYEENYTQNEGKKHTINAVKTS